MSTPPSDTGPLVERPGVASRVSGRRASRAAGPPAADTVRADARRPPPPSGDDLATVKVRGGEDGALSVVEFAAPRGLGPPLHQHDDEDELFVVLSGEVAFHTGGDRVLTGDGGLAFLPHGIPHTFQGTPTPRASSA